PPRSSSRRLEAGEGARANDRHDDVRARRQYRRAPSEARRHRRGHRRRRDHRDQDPPGVGRMSGGARRAATAAERSRARRLRARADLSAPDRAWLEAYEAERRAYEAERRGAPPPPPPKAPPVEAPLEP